MSDYKSESKTRLHLHMQATKVWEFSWGEGGAVFLCPALRYKCLELQGEGRKIFAFMSF